MVFPVFDDHLVVFSVLFTHVKINEQQSRMKKLGKELGKGSTSFGDVEQGTPTLRGSAVALLCKITVLTD